MGHGFVAAESVGRASALERAGFRVGACGTHSTRPLLLRELSELLQALPPSAPRSDYRAAVVDENALGKPTRSTRLTTWQCLAQLYGLDPGIPLFRVFRRLWALERRNARGRALLAVLSALARDPLLRTTAGPVLALAPGEELVRAEFEASIREETGARFNDAVLRKVASNAASSWSRSGHLRGRVQKERRAVSPTPAAAALAIWLGEVEGRAGLGLIDSAWAAALDAPDGAMRDQALRASRLGLVRLRAAGNVVEASARALDPGASP